MMWFGLWCYIVPMLAFAMSPPNNCGFVDGPLGRAKVVGMAIFWPIWTPVILYWMIRH